MAALLHTWALLLLLTGQVTMVTSLRAEGLTCRQEVHPELIRELWNRTRQLLDTLPKEEKSSKRTRLLPKFCTRCSEGAIGWVEIQEMVDVYQRTVFSQDQIKKLLPLHFPDLMHRLERTLHNCVPTDKPSKWSKLIKKLERKIKKRKGGALKAVSEFMFILRWTGELAHHRIL